MTPLRQRMIDLLTVRHYSPRTIESYLFSMTALVKFYRRSPDLLTSDDIQNYLIHVMKDLQLSPSSCRLRLHGIRFFYLHVLGWDIARLALHYPKKEQRIPELLTHAEVDTLLNQPTNFKHQTMLKVCYGTGLRVSELVGLKVTDIDGERQLLRIEQGKGRKDRLVPIPPSLMTLLREFWFRYRPTDVLFYSDEDHHQPLSVQSPQRIYRKAKRQAGIQKHGGIHSLRHAYATHQLEAGLPVHILQRYLGHQDLHTTMRYIHWVPDYRPGAQPGVDLLAKPEVPHVYDGAGA